MSVLGLLVLCAPLPAPAPQAPKARAELFVRPASGATAQGGPGVRAAIRIRLEPGWHLYHDELGPPDAVGMPTRAALSPGEWSVRFPQPERMEQPGLGEDGGDTWIWGHSGTLVLHAAGVLEAGAEPGDVGASLRGLTCQDDGTCIPWSAELESAGAGPDALFASFPADLAPPGGAAAPAEAGEPTGQAPAAQPGAARGPPRLPKLPAFGAAKGDRERVGAALHLRPGQPTAEGLPVRAALVLDVEEGWYVYHDDVGPPDAAALPTRVELDGAGGTWSPARFPAPLRKEQPGLGADGGDTWTWAHEGRVVLHAAGLLPPGSDPGEVVARVEGQVCADVCLPFELEVPAGGPGADALFAGFPADLTPRSARAEPAPAGRLAPGGAGEPTAVLPGLAAFLWLAVFWGLFTLLMPCTYPMIPITISFFTKQAEQRGKAATSLSLAYGLGIVAIFILIGVVVGGPIVKFATHPVTNLVIGALFGVFALALFGVFELRPPAFLMNAAGQASRRGGYVGVFLMGATLVITSFTCTAPFVGSLLAVGAADGDLGRVALGMAVFGATMAVPFVLLSMVPAKLKAMPRSGEWMHVLKVFLGFVELAAALKFISNADIVWGWNLLTRELFLVLWLGIFLVAALFLLGLVRLKGEVERDIGPLRLVGATLVLLFALYCGYGVLGHPMDTIMTAIAPPADYGKVDGAVAAGLGQPAPRRKHPIVRDHYAAAQELAMKEDKLLLVNFTGFS